MSFACADLHELIEPIAAGERPLDAAISGHLGECSRCSAKLELARRLDRMLQSAEIPTPPSGFVPAVARRVRGEWWRAEQHLDLWFNVAIATGLTVALGGLWLLLNLSGLTAVTADVSRLFMAGFDALIARMTPSLPIYGGTTLLLLTGLAVWWWAEHEITL